MVRLILKPIQKFFFFGMVSYNITPFYLQFINSKTTKYHNCKKTPHPHPHPISLSMNAADTSEPPEQTVACYFHFRYHKVYSPYLQGVIYSSLSSSMVINPTLLAYLYNNIRSAQIAKFMGPTWGAPGSCRPQMGPMLVPWTLLSGWVSCHQSKQWWMGWGGSRVLSQTHNKINKFLLSGSAIAN